MAMWSPGLNTAVFLALPNGPRQPLGDAQRSEVGCIRWVGVQTPQAGLTARHIISQNHLIMPDAPVELSEEHSRFLGNNSLLTISPGKSS
jgi:hypothetical protein